MQKVNHVIIKGKGLMTLDHLEVTVWEPRRMLTFPNLC